MSQAQQARVIKLVDTIMLILAGNSVDEAETALTVAVAAEIIAVVDPRDRKRAAENFAEQVLNLLDSPEHVAWISAAVKRPPPSGGELQ